MEAPLHSGSLPPSSSCGAQIQIDGRRDRSDLGNGPAGLIAKRVLAYDIADYIRFRAVCRPWRQCCTDPRAHGGLDRRFHPRRWVLLREPLSAAPNRRYRFLNSSTGEFIQLDLPELLDHEVLAATPEGLLVLLRQHNHDDVCLLNPLTCHLTNLPPLTTLLPSELHYKLSPRFHIDYCFIPPCSGIANYDSTVVLCFHRPSLLGIAKPGDDRWTMVLGYRNGGVKGAPLMLAGRFYHVKHDAVMVLQMGTANQQQPWRLEVAAKLKMHVLPMEHSLHLVDDNHGELLLVHHQVVPLTRRNKSAYRYGMYRVDLDAGRVLPVKSLGGGAMFLSPCCSLVVSPEVFPFGSISVDTIYLSFDFHERSMLKVGAYHLADGRIERPCSRLVPRPHTLVDYLTLAIMHPLSHLAHTSL